MKKILQIGWKDMLLLFRDRGALILMLAAPFLLTLGLGLVSGAFSDNDSNSGLADIPVALVISDDGELGQAVGDLFASEELADLVEPVIVTDTAVARQQVDNDEVVAAVIVPDGFTASIVPENMTTGETTTAVPIEIYINPARPISADVITSIVREFINRTDTSLISIETTLVTLSMNQLAPFTDQAAMQRLGQAVGERAITQISESGNSLITLRQEETAVNTQDFNLLSYFAPGMALTFLMYTVTQGGRSVLAERNGGTLSRLLSSPTAISQVLGGKVLGIFLSGTAQVAVLIIGSTLLFRLTWGDTLGVALLVLAAALAATGWGILLAAISREPSQVSTYGTALMLLFGLVGGGFVALPREGAVYWLGKITPNSWALDGFLALAQGQTVNDIGSEITALVIMGCLLFGTAVLLFRRRSDIIA